MHRNTKEYGVDVGVELKKGDEKNNKNLKLGMSYGNSNMSQSS
jgi:hypothetical protein